MSSNDILFIAEHEGGQAKKGAFELATKARALAAETGGSVIGVALGPGAASAAEQLGAYGANVVLVNEDSQYVDFSIGPAAATIAAIVAERKPKLVLASATPTSKDVAARVAAKTGAGIISNVLDVNIEGGAASVAVSIFGGSTNVSKTYTGDTGIALIRPNAVTPEQVGGTATVETAPAVIPQEALLAKILDRVAEAGAQAPLEEASIIVSGGRGLGGPEGFELLRDLAAELNGVIGASRAAVDAGWISYPHQVGQTGKTVKPQLYIACGISGAVQHKVGMQTSTNIVAINKNSDAPIFQFADCNIVGDLFQVVPELVKEIKKRK